MYEDEKIYHAHIPQSAGISLSQGANYLSFQRKKWLLREQFTIIEYNNT
jgi:hypothetical protein